MSGTRYIIYPRLLVYVIYWIYYFVHGPILVILGIDFGHQTLRFGGVLNVRIEAEFAD